MNLLKVSSKLTSSQRIYFFTKLAGIFAVVLSATGSVVVVDAKMGGALGLPFTAFVHYADMAMRVYAFGKISRVHFNLAVTVVFLFSCHIKKS
jgi:aquaporin Z